MGGTQSITKEETDHLLRQQEERLRKEFAGERQFQRQYMETLVESLKPLRVTKEDRFMEFLNQLDARYRDRMAPVQCHAIRVMVMGMVSVGKTTLINSLLGCDMPTGLDATTTKITQVGCLPLHVAGRLFNMAFIDCPGVDKTFSYSDPGFVEALALANVIVVAYTSSVDYLESIIRIADAMHKPLLFVRTCCDMASPEQVSLVIERDQTKIGMLLRGGRATCLGVSARHPDQHPLTWGRFTDHLKTVSAALALNSHEFDNAPTIATDEVLVEVATDEVLAEVATDEESHTFDGVSMSVSEDGVITIEEGTCENAFLADDEAEPNNNMSSFDDWMPVHEETVVL